MARCVHSQSRSPFHAIAKLSRPRGDIRDERNPSRLAGQPLQPATSSSRTARAGARTVRPATGDPSRASPRTDSPVLISLYGSICGRSSAVARSTDSSHPGGFSPPHLPGVWAPLALRRDDLRAWLVLRPKLRPASLVRPNTIKAPCAGGDHFVVSFAWSSRWEAQTSFAIDGSVTRGGMHVTQ
jgi:hypothetical protein